MWIGDAKNLLAMTPPISATVFGRNGMSAQPRFHACSARVPTLTPTHGCLFTPPMPTIARPRELDHARHRHCPPRHPRAKQNPSVRQSPPTLPSPRASAALRGRSGEAVRGLLPGLANPEKGRRTAPGTDQTTAGRPSMASDGVLVGWGICVFYPCQANDEAGVADGAEAGRKGEAMTRGPLVNGNSIDCLRSCRSTRGRELRGRTPNEGIAQIVHMRSVLRSR
jgi:hypothetical protein